MIWLASSRVGAKPVRARCAFGAGFAFQHLRDQRIPKAAVLPVPVCARPITSRPFIPWGNRLFLDRVGSVMPMLVML